MKRCPCCGHEVEEAALQCIFCGKFLTPGRQKTHARWYQTNTFLIVGFLVVGPFILPLVWFNPRFNIKTKIIWTTVIAVITALLILLLERAVSQLMSYYDLVF